MVKEYRKGEENEFFLREADGTYFLEKITKDCGFAIKVGTKEEIEVFIKENGFEFVREFEKQY